MKIHLLLSLPSIVNGLEFPIGITNCGIQSWIQTPPKRAVTMNQGTTEIMLALGLADSMVGTAYLDDYIWSELEAEYKTVPVIAKEYPTIGELLAVEPDFVYASYGSAFATSSVNYTQGLPSEILGEDGQCDLVTDQSLERDGSHCRAELHEAGIQTYLQKPYCELIEHRPTGGAADTIPTLFNEIWDIASIFDVSENARQLVNSIDEHFDQAVAVATSAGPDVPPIKVLWLDGWDDAAPFVGACCGSIQTIVEKAGAKHIFDDQGIDEVRTWDSVSWDSITERDPDVIVLVDASWDLADEKIFKLCSNEQTRKLRAVQSRAFLVVPFSASTLGVRIGAVSYNLAEAMAAIIRGEALPSIQFSETSIAAHGGTDGSVQAVGKSGVRAFEKLPMWNGTDLNLLCPGSSTPIQIRDDIPLMSTASADANKNLALGLGFGLGLTCLLLLGFAVVYHNKYKLMGEEMKRLKTEYAVETAVPSTTVEAHIAASVSAKDDESVDAEFADIVKA